MREAGVTQPKPKKAQKTQRDYEALREDLVARAGTMSKRLSQVARFFLNHPEEVAINTLVRLAEQASVPPATITRFTKELGFAGFAELQGVFRERLLGPRLPYAARMAEPGMQPGSDVISNADLDEPGHEVKNGSWPWLVRSRIYALFWLDHDNFAAG